jgi:hypothetical protein
VQKSIIQSIPSCGLRPAIANCRIVATLLLIRIGLGSNGSRLGIIEIPDDGQTKSASILPLNIRVSALIRGWVVYMPVNRVGMKVCNPEL